MGKKFLDENGLSHLWDKITATFVKKDELNGNGGGDSSTLIVKAVPTLDFSSGSIVFSGIASIDKGVDEILIAANSGRNVLLEFNVGINLGIVQYARSVMTLYSDNNMNFDGVFDMSGQGSPFFIRVTGSNKNGYDDWTVSMRQLVTQDQLGGFRFTSSSSAPTDDDKALITFVDEG